MAHREPLQHPVHGVAGIGMPQFGVYALQSFRRRQGIEVAGQRQVRPRRD